MYNIAKVLALAVTVAGIVGCASSRPFVLQDALVAEGYVVIPLRKLASGHETLEVTINGSRGVFVLDSGAGGSVVHQDFSQLFDLNRPVGVTREGTGAGGGIQLNAFAVSSFSLDDTVLPVNTIMVTDIGSVVTALKAATGTEVSGVIGQDILTGYAGIIDIREQKLYLKPSKSPVQ